MRIRLALAGGLLLLLVALALVLSSSAARTAGTNYVPENAEALMLRGDDRHCQASQVVPKDTGGLRLLIGTYGRETPPLSVRVRAGGELLTSGRLPADQGEGRVSIPLGRVDRTTAGATVCIRAQAGEGRRTVLYGTTGLVSLEWLRGGRESWYELAPTVARRFALAKANPIGSWLLPLTALLFLAAVGVAVRLVARELRS